MARIWESNGKMSIQFSLIDLPQEILVMVLNIHFSNTTIKIRQCLRRSRRNASSNSQRLYPGCKCLEVLLINKALHAIGKLCFYNNVTIWSNAMFNEQHPYHMTWICSQVPWAQITSVSGNLLFAILFQNALVYRQVSIHRLRDISIHHTYAAWTSIEAPENTMAKSVGFLAEVCQAKNIGFHAFQTVCMSIHSRGATPRDWLKMDLKVVIRRDLSMELHELKTAQKSLYMQCRDRLEQVWQYGLPIFGDSESEDVAYRPRSLEIEWREA